MYSIPHVVVKDFAKIDDIATDEELDMLDLAFGLSDTSRLGCQVIPGIASTDPMEKVSGQSLVRFILSTLEIVPAAPSGP